MSYVTQKQSYDPVAILGAIGIPAAFAGLLVVGLAVKAVVEEKEDKPFGGVIITPEPPPLPDPVEQTSEQPKTKPPLTNPYVPDAPFDLPRPGVDLDSTGELTPLGGDIDVGGVEVGGLGGGIGGNIAPQATFDPVNAKPANNPARWVTDSDYRSIWVRREYTGTARFTLDISASGRVSNCTITSSTGHTQLDTATCRLITDRARFNPALDSNGAPTTGTFTSSINWQLPD